MAYEQERAAFEQLKNNCTPEAKGEYVAVISLLLDRYNTSIQENKFYVGGAVEVFTCSLFRSAGVKCNFHNQENNILLPGGQQLAINSSFTSYQNVNLINKMGEGDRSWGRATLFIISGVGIVYGAPGMVNPRDLNTSGDAIILPKRALINLASNPENVMTINIPGKPDKTEHSRRASLAVALRALQDMNTDAGILLNGVAEDLM